MPKEVIDTRDGSVTVGFDSQQVQIGLDLGKVFKFDGENDEFSSLWVSLTADDITRLQKNLARAKRYISK